MARDIMKYFTYDHLKNDRLKDISKQFAKLAEWIDAELVESPESTVALRKLLEAKDAAVRAAL